MIGEWIAEAVAGGLVLAIVMSVVGVVLEHRARKKGSKRI